MVGGVLFGFRCSSPAPRSGLRVLGIMKGFLQALRGFRNLNLSP